MRRPGLALACALMVLGDLPTARAEVAVTAPAIVASTADPCGEKGICDAKALKPFLKALFEVESGKRKRPVHILQIGDSHTAADAISGALRARLQARFGEAGRGALPPGRPFKAYNPRQVEVQQSDGWRLEASFLPAHFTESQGARPGEPAPAVLTSGPFGLSGWRLVSTRAGASLTLKADPEARFDQAVVCALAGPDAGELVVLTEEGERRMPLAAIRVQPVCRRFEFAGPQNRLALTASDGPVTLLSFATFRNQPGVALSNLGVIGTQLGDFAARDDEVMRAELEAYAPDLIVLAYGTNDGFADHVDGPGYETAVRDQIRRLRRLSPGTPVLLLGAPDANTLRKGIRADGKEDRGFDCSPLTSVEIADFARLTADRSPQLARWFPPAGLAVVRDAQKRAAEGEGAAFWDWAARMGGPCSAHRLSHSTPRLVMGDHVHFTTDGGDLIAGLLWQDLTDAYTAQMGGR